MESWSSIASEPYYFLHFLLFFSYIPVRSSASIVLAPYITDHLLHREIQAALAFLVLTAVKLFNFIFLLVSSDNGKAVRTETWEAFIGDTLFFGKAFLIVVSLIIDYHVALWYAVIFLVMFALTDQPVHQGIGTSMKLTPLQLETLLTEGNTSKYWLVEFRAACSPHCTNASRCFTELSVTYSNKNLSFGIIDLGLFPNVAERFGISLGTNGQLPTYILFENATEIGRFPEIGFESRPSHPPVTKRLLAQHFELDRLLLEYVNGK